MRTFIIIIAALIGLAMVAGVAVLWLLQDPNRYKPEIEALISDNTGMQVQLQGDLSWRLWPPVVLQAEDLTFEDEETAYALNRLDLNASAAALLSYHAGTAHPQPAAHRLTMSDKRFESVTEVSELRLTDFALGKPSNLHLEAVSGASGDAPLPITLDAVVTYFQHEDRAVVKDARFNADGIPGVCQVQAANITRSPSSNHAETADDLLPLDTFRAIDWDADCVIERVEGGGVELRNIAVKAVNTGGLSTSTSPYRSSSTAPPPWT